MAPNKEESFQTNRELFREMLDNQKSMLEQNQQTNIELLKHAFNIDKLNDKSQKHDDYIERDKKIKWLGAGGVSLLVFFKDTIFKHFGL